MFQLYEVRVISKALKVYLGTYYGKCLAIEQKIKDNQKAGLPTLELENNLKVAQKNLKEVKEIRLRVITTLKQIDKKA